MALFTCICIWPQAPECKTNVSTNANTIVAYSFAVDPRAFKNLKALNISFGDFTPTTNLFGAVHRIQHATCHSSLKWQEGADLDRAVWASPCIRLTYTAFGGLNPVLAASLKGSATGTKISTRLVHTVVMNIRLARSS